MNKHGGYLGDNAAMLDFSININPLGMPEGVRQAILEAVDTLGRYPEITGVSARDKLAADVGVAPEQLILGNGAIELIYLFVKSLRPRRAMIVTPTFNEYARALAMNADCQIRTFQLSPEDDFYLDPEKFCADIKSWRPEVIFICNPNNPTGKLLDGGLLAEIMLACPESVRWFIDESFIEFSGAAGCLDFLKTNQRELFLLRSLTKFFGVPGLRIGYGVGSPEIVKAMAAHKEPWTINALALAAAKVVYDDDAYIEKTRRNIQTERQRVRTAVQGLSGIKVYESAADFHLYGIDGSTAELQKRLNAKNINVRTCEDFPGLEAHFFRAAIKNPRDNDRFIAALSEILGEQE
ncbi:MAG: aminotransferase class I/II-fold pyridoxal phosphate-dependent enzyme [Eubacterium sp.]|nr:aminotransferase class I/II-fold pyridoxal phosphate-dependent enzyme [Eubacterium sp.]